MTNYEWIKKHTMTEMIIDDLNEILDYGTLPIQISDKAELVLELLSERSKPDDEPAKITYSNTR